MMEFTVTSNDVPLEAETDAMVPDAVPVAVSSKSLVSTLETDSVKATLN